LNKETSQWLKGSNHIQTERGITDMEGERGKKLALFMATGGSLGTCECVGGDERN